MPNINTSVIVNFNLRDDIQESSAEVVNHIGALRTVMNTFTGQDAITLYTGLLGQTAVTIDDEVRRILGIVSPSEHYENMFNKPIEYLPMKPTIDIPTDDWKLLSYEHSGELAPDMIVRHNFHTEREATYVLDDIKKMLTLYGSYTMTDWKDVIEGDHKMVDFGYILDDSEELAVLQSEEGFYIYPLIFKAIAKAGTSHISQTDQLI